MLIPTNLKELRSLLGDLSYYQKCLPKMARGIHPVTTLLKTGLTFDFTPDMETIVRGMPDERDH